MPEKADNLSVLKIYISCAIWRLASEKKKLKVATYTPSMQMYAKIMRNYASRMEICQQLEKILRIII